MIRRPLLALAALAALGAAPARAAAASPLSGSFELRVGNYRPDADAGITPPPGQKPPYEGAFGTSRPKFLKLHVAKAIPWRLAGTFEVGLGAGWWEVNGRATDANGDPTSERTAFKIVPTELTATWRLDLLWERLSVPFVPYARASLQRYNWWITGPGGSTVKSGATNGFAYGGGVGLVLNFLDPVLARELDADSGVNHTMVVLDVSKTKVDDFGAGSSWDLSDDKVTYSLGLLFVF